ncbi:MAG: hypothetical protein RBS77_03870 [Candidatus Moranbacteria bacterium]|jgi:hypothetical protein|nr:hypothetical protein [Candidatus Moranbacteria bacterium]
MATKKEALKKYLEADKKLKDYRSQFVGTGWEGEKFNAPKKVLTKKAIEELKKLEKELEEAHKEYAG